MRALWIVLLRVSIQPVNGGTSFAYERKPALLEPGASPGTPSLSADCVLAYYNLCSCYVWTFTESAGAVWGTIFDPDDCAGGCASGGAVTDVWFYARCPSGVAAFGGLAVSTIDAGECLVSELYDTGPFTTARCVEGDRWTRVEVPGVHMNSERFAVTLTWGGDKTELVTENTIANLLCSFGLSGTFPGCAPGCDCDGWAPPRAHTFIWVTDFDGDTKPEDLCELYGYPYALAFPYYGYIYPYFPNNLLMRVGLDCSPPTSVEATSWGHVKALYE